MNSITNVFQNTMMLLITISVMTIAYSSISPKDTTTEERLKLLEIEVDSISNDCAYLIDRTTLLSTFADWSILTTNYLIGKDSLLVPSKPPFPIWKEYFEGLKKAI